ncbi:MAG: hypothetical protein MK101_10695 [Phycisphaerales bacterium]|nr:hypothetical protein [Phycisphaerales bacterium]
MWRQTLLGVALVAQGLSLPGCGSGDAEPQTPPHQRMRVVRLDPLDVEAIQAPRFDAFREALVAVRLKASQRPQAADGAPAMHEALARFNGELETTTVVVINIMRADGWSRDDHDLMNRALRRATLADLQSP